MVGVTRYDHAELNGRDPIKGNDGFVFTAPVGKYKPNGFGLHDMHGSGARTSTILKSMGLAVAAGVQALAAWFGTVPHAEQASHDWP